MVCEKSVIVIPGSISNIIDCSIYRSASSAERKDASLATLRRETNTVVQLVIAANGSMSSRLLIHLLIVSRESWWLGVTRCTVI